MSAAPVELGHVGLPAVNASAAAAKPVKTANSIAHSAKASSGAPARSAVWTGPCSRERVLFDPGMTRAQSSPKAPATAPGAQGSAGETAPKKRTRRRAKAQRPIPKAKARPTTGTGLRPSIRMPHTECLFAMVRRLRQPRE
jgi:hypothetical protein